MMDRSRFRTKSIGVKVTEADFSRLQTLAEAQGKPMGEWCRDVLLTTAEVEKPSAGEQILLAEVLALRTILLNVLFAMASAKTLTAEEMTKLIERADREKLTKALALLEDRIKVGP
jgi:hypothetical protein